MNAGWGDPCDLCPKQGTREFSIYCPNGIGYNRNQTGKLEGVLCKFILNS